MAPAYRRPGGGHHGDRRGVRALNTIYSAVAERGREIATMRALGFSSWNVILSFLFEALLISLIAGIIGCVVVLKTRANPLECLASAWSFRSSDQVIESGFGPSLIPFVTFTKETIPLQRSSGFIGSRPRSLQTAIHQKTIFPAS